MDTTPSETEMALKSGLAKFFGDNSLRVLDVGFGGKAVCPHAITFDMPQPYTHVGGDRQILRGDCRDLSCICDEAFDIVYSSHVLEDFTWPVIKGIVSEFFRILKPGGLLITVCPDEKAYREHCGKTGHSYNENHINDDMSLSAFVEKALPPIERWDPVHEKSLADIYSWHLVIKKI